jgi:hypothetical protein
VHPHLALKPEYARRVHALVSYCRYECMSCVTMCVRRTSQRIFKLGLEIPDTQPTIWVQIEEAAVTIRLQLPAHTISQLMVCAAVVDEDVVLSARLQRR